MHREEIDEIFEDRNTEESQALLAWVATDQLLVKILHNFDKVMVQLGVSVEKLVDRRHQREHWKRTMIKVLLA